VRALALWLLMAGQAAADMVSINGTSVVLQDSDAPGAFLTGNA
jgi:P pilus assembly chaperone PapD